MEQAGKAAAQTAAKQTSLFQRALQNKFYYDKWLFGVTSGVIAVTIYRYRTMEQKQPKTPVVKPPPPKKLTDWDHRWIKLLKEQQNAMSEGESSSSSTISESLFSESVAGCFEIGQDRAPYLAPWDSGRPSRAARDHLHELFNGDSEDLPPIVHVGQTRTIRVAIPLCGSSRDMIAIDKHVESEINRNGNKKGGSVQSYKRVLSGIDTCDEALTYLKNGWFNGQELKKEEDIKTQITWLSDTLRIVNTDFFEEGTVMAATISNCVFDRMALSCINPDFRDEYMYAVKRILTKHGRVLLTVYHFDSKQRNLAYQKKAKELKEQMDLMETENGEIDASLQAEFDHLNEGPSFPYSMSEREVRDSFKYVAGPDSSMIRKIKSVKMSESDDPWERWFADKFMLGSEATLDIYVIEHHSCKPIDLSKSVSLANPASR